MSEFPTIPRPAGEHTRLRDYGHVRALFINATLKRSPEPSNTDGLLDRAAAVMSSAGVTVERIRAADHDIATGIYPDMREHRAASDAWPEIYPRVMAADILV